VIAALVAVSVASQASAQIPITGCGEFASNGILTADLDCSAASGASIHVASGGTVDLDGFTITGGAGAGIDCEARCTIVGGGGTVTGDGQSVGVYSEKGAMEISDLSIIGRSTGIVGIRANITATNVFVGGAERDGIRIQRGKLALVDSTVSANGLSGIMGSDRARVRINGSVIDGNAAVGVSQAHTLSSTDSSFTNNLLGGIHGLKVTLTNVIATGNGLGVPICEGGATNCADLSATKLVAGSTPTCDTSHRLDRDLNGTGETLGVCALD